MSHTGFIIAAYLVAGALLGALIVASVLDYRHQRRRLAENGASEEQS